MRVKSTPSPAIPPSLIGEFTIEGSSEMFTTLTENALKPFDKIHFDEMGTLYADEILEEGEGVTFPGAKMGESDSLSSFMDEDSESEDEVAKERKLALLFINACIEIEGPTSNLVPTQRQLRAYMTTGNQQIARTFFVRRGSMFKDHRYFIAESFLDLATVRDHFFGDVSGEVPLRPEFDEKSSPINTFL